ncbi:hypothetical protein Tco_1353787 [Tanacetum coccineum]
MRMRQYICHTDHNLWDVIVNGDLEEEPAPARETSAFPAPKTAKQLAAKRNQEIVKSILLLAIPDEYILKFHNVADAKSLWDAIKARRYDRFQKLISQLEVHGALISKEDINQKFLRSLPPSWNQIALIMRNKPDIDEIDIDDLYNNLGVYEDEMKKSLSFASTSQNLAFLSSENTSSTNEVSTASGDFGVSTAGGISQIDEDDLEELDLRWQVMAISVISISSDSSEDSVGTPAGRVILFESDPSEDPSSDHILPLPAISPFLSLDDDTTDSDTPDTPPSPTHGTPFTEITASTQRSPIIPRCRVMILSPRQPIPHGRPYRYHLNGPVHMMTARKRVGPLPTHRLAVRHSADHSSSDSSSEASSDFHSDASSDSSSRHSLSDHSSPDLPSTSAGPSRKRRRSPMTSVPALPLVSGALSPVRADLIPSPKRVKDSGYLADVEVDPREISLRDDAIVRVSDEPHLEQDIDPEIQAEIDECIAYADALRDRGIDARVVVEAIDRDETETGVRGPIEVRVERVTHPAMPEDIPEPTQEGAVEVTYETLGDLVQRFHDHTQAIPVHRIQAIEGVQREQGHRIVGVESAVTALTERIAELERDNRRLRDTASVEDTYYINCFCTWL